MESSDKMGRLAHFLRECTRRRVVHTALAYGAVAWVIVQIAAVSLPAFEAPAWVLRFLIATAAIGFPIALILAWVFEMTPDGLQRTDLYRSQEDRSEVAVGRQVLTEDTLPSRDVWRITLLSSVIGALLLGVSVWLFAPFPGVEFEERDWLLISEMENLTEDPLFDYSLDRVLATGIQQSGYVNVFPRSRVRETLRRMKRVVSDTLDESLAREVAVRENLDGVLVPSISRIGDQFAVTARIVDPWSGGELHAVSVRATGKNEVLDAVDRLTREVREGLGESLSAVRDQSTYLPAATTTSLRALREFAQGTRAWEEGRYDDAVASLRRAVEEDSSFAWAHVMLGNYYYFFHGNPQLGEAHYRSATSELNRLPEREKLWLQAQIEGSRGDLQEAVRILKGYVERYPDSRDAWYNLGTNLMRMGRYDDAVAGLHRALEIDPRMAAAYANLATSYSLAERPEEALEQYRNAFEIQPEWVTGQFLNYEYGHTHLMADQPEEAERIFRLMLGEADREKQAKGHRSLALGAIYGGRYTEAIDHLQTAATINRLDENPVSELRDRLFLVNVLLTKGQPAKAREQVRKIDPIQKANYVQPYFIQVLGRLHLRVGNEERATDLAAVIEERITEERTKDRAAGRLLAGQIAAAQNDSSGAVSAIEEAVYLEDNLRYEAALARTYSSFGRLEQARDTYMGIIGHLVPPRESMEPWILARYRLARVYERLGQHDEAIQTYEAFLEFWSGADPDLVPVVRAKDRLVRLREKMRQEPPERVPSLAS